MIAGTEQEVRLHDAFDAMGIKHEANQIVCFMCGKYFKNTMPGVYPSSCLHCCAPYDARGRYCMPDILFKCEGRIGIVFVNGQVHDKAKVRKKDLLQIAALRHYGYCVFVIKNEAIDNATVSVLRAIAEGYAAALLSEEIYRRMYVGEKELPGYQKPGSHMWPLAFDS